MKHVHTRGWRFVHPQDNDIGGSVGLQIASQGGIAMIDDESAVRQSLLLLLSTTPGERVMRPQYGCPLQKLIFMPNDETTAGIAIHYVREAVQHWEPRAEVLRVDAGWRDSDPPEQLSIYLEYRVLLSQEISTLALQLNLTGDFRQIS